MVTNELDNLAILWNKTKNPYYKNLWYKKVKEFSYGKDPSDTNSPIQRRSNSRRISSVKRDERI